MSFLVFAYHENECKLQENESLIDNENCYQRMID